MVCLPPEPIKFFPAGSPQEGQQQTLLLFLFELELESVVVKSQPIYMNKLKLLFFNL